MKSRTSVTPDGHFLFGIHKPSYTVKNLREQQVLKKLGHDQDNVVVDNIGNYPMHDIIVEQADWIYEIPNHLPFRGTTYINKKWADANAEDNSRMHLPVPEPLSLTDVLNGENISPDLVAKLPPPLLLTLATTSTDSRDLIVLAELCCQIEKDEEENPTGLLYQQHNGSRRAVIHNHALFEAVANNPHLPDGYKEVMVLRPGAQGGSEITAEYQGNGNSQVFEYLRRNSYIAGGHYAANMGDDAVRYSIKDLSLKDMQGIRHLYYQRTYIRIAEQLDIPLVDARKSVSEEELEALRKAINKRLVTKEKAAEKITDTATLWGWNFGFDYAPTGYRLHASHQQVHQQYALIPDQIETCPPFTDQQTLPAFGCGDMIAELMENYQDNHSSDFFGDLIKAILNNRRMDERDDRPQSLIIYQDDNIILFVPKAQTSQWELQLLTRPARNGTKTGNIIEADQKTRNSLDHGILLAQQALAGLGAKMVTSIEYSKRIINGHPGQHLLYVFLPRLPESPGAFSEAQMRFINGHYPEDFAAACRTQLNTFPDT